MRTITTVVMPGGTRRLDAGELLLLPAHQRYSLRARADAAVLMTLIRHERHVGGGTPGGGA